MSQVRQESHGPAALLKPPPTCSTCDIRQLAHVENVRLRLASQVSDVSLAHVRHVQKAS